MKSMTISRNAVLPVPDVSLNGCKKRCDGIADMPGIGRQREELSPGLRSVPEGDYVIFYRQIEDGVEIIRVLHGKRDIPTIFGVDS